MTAKRPAPDGGMEAVLLDLWPILLRRARAMGAGPDAEDVLQDVWLRIRAVQGPISNPQAYLFRMVYTAVLDRRRGVRRAMARETLWSGGLAQTDGHDVVPPDAERRLVALETLAAVEARLDKLGDPAALIFRLHRIAGQPQRQIAIDLGMGLSTVEKHLRSAYAALLDLQDVHNED